jgi:hypothetical protein
MVRLSSIYSSLESSKAGLVFSQAFNFRNRALLLFREICSTMKLWSIFHVYSIVTSTDVMHWILALPMHIRATDVMHWILALPMRDICGEFHEFLGTKNIDLL